MAYWHMRALVYRGQIANSLFSYPTKDFSKQTPNYFNPWDHDSLSHRFIVEAKSILKM